MLRKQDRELSRLEDLEVTEAPARRGGLSARLPFIIALIVIIAALLAFFVWREPEGTPQTQATSEQESSQTTGGQAASTQPGGAPAPPPPSDHGPVVRVIEAMPSVTGAEGPAAEQAERKKPYGLDQSVDAVVRSDETIQVGDQQVPVSELARKLGVEQRGEIVEQFVGQKGKVSAWGVHLVRPGENLWDIHYALLQEYLAHKGVELPPKGG